MARFVGLDVSQKLTAICVVDETGHRLWRGQCATDPGQIERAVRGQAGEDAGIGVETGPMTPWLVHQLRDRGRNVVCLDARHARAVLKMQMNETDQNDAEGLAQIMRTGWYRPVRVRSLDAHRARAPPGARAQLVGMTTRLSNHLRGVLKTFGMLPGAMRGLPFDRRVEELLADRGRPGADCPAHADSLAAAARADCRVRQGGACTGKEGPNLPPADERARHRRPVRAGLREHGRGPGALCPVTAGRRAHGADAQAASVRRGGPERQDLAVR